MPSVQILEVSPRDGFQAVKPFIPTERKIAIIEELAACGIQRLEIGSFVSPKAVPQLADTPEILKRARLPKGLRVNVLVPNAKGLQLALNAGVKEISWVISVSESHNRSNVNRSVDESFANFADAWRGLGGERPKLRLGLSTCFDCPWEGRVPEDKVIACVERVIEIAPEVEIGICDTTGRAAPDHVASLFERIMPRYASDRVTFAYHGHDTYGLGVANAIEAYRQGVRVIDGAAGGLGGCPFAPGAAGNTATEDLVFAFEHMGIDTGIDFDKLLAVADRVAAVAPDQSGGKLRTVPRRRALAGFGAATQGLGASA
ncbi:MAG TPA: hydroxymethylglutaryl-CoA lyase [Hyphomicrobiaceae bacterium]|jgi:hydroxymethylglutaryl-CoA lyase|nr:hydroxymethylglutaryl-CoA lyase [Hyphomicrobiaceae bacterium]